MWIVRKEYGLSLVVVAAVVAGLVITFRSEAAAPGASANGSGSLPSINDNGDTVKRQFSFNAQQKKDGTVQGHAVLHNPAFTGENGHSPYMLQIDIQCMKVIGNTAFFGGTTRRTNDPSLIDAVYFSAQDNGEPGAGVDLLSRAFFFDDDPGTNGDPQLCQGNQLGDFPMEPIQTGNIQIRP
jgi:hypothetical protein